MIAVEVPIGLRNALLMDGPLSGLLAPYNGGPAVFVGEAPEGAELPFVVVGDSVSESRFDTKTTRGRIVTREVMAFDRLDSVDPSRVEQIAERVSEILHHGRIAIQGHYVVDARVVEGPRAAPVEGAVGRAIQLRLTLQEARS